jgi:hypothetical protein
MAVDRKGCTVYVVALLIIDTSKEDEGLKYIPKLSTFIENCGLLLLDILKYKN